MTSKAKPAPSSRIRHLFRKRSAAKPAVPIDQLLREENGHLLREMIEKVLESLPHHHPHLCTSASTQTDDLVTARCRSASTQTVADASLAFSHQAVQTSSNDEQEANDDDYDGDDDDRDDKHGNDKAAFDCKLESLQIAPKPHNHTLSHILVTYASSPTVESDPSRSHQTTPPAKPIPIRTRHGTHIPWRDKYIRIRLPPTPLPRLVPLRTASSKPTTSSLSSDMSQPWPAPITPGCDNEDLVLTPSVRQGTLKQEVGPHGIKSESPDNAPPALADRHLPGPPDGIVHEQSVWPSNTASHIFGSQKMGDSESVLYRI